MGLVVHKVSLRLQGCGLQFLQISHLLLIDLALILPCHRLCLGIECVSLSRVFLLISGLHRVVLILLCLEDFKVHIDPKDRQDPNEHLDPKRLRDPQDRQDPRDHLDPKHLRDPKDRRDPNDHLDPKDRQSHLDLKDHQDTKGGKEIKDHKDPKGSKDLKDQQDLKDNKEWED